MGLKTYLSAYKSNANALGMSEECFFLQELWKYAGGQSSTVIDAVLAAATEASDSTTVTQITQVKAGASAVVNGGSGGGGFSVFGAFNDPIVITASGGLAGTSEPRALFFTASTGGTYEITASPQISAGTTVGQEMRITGTSDSNAIIFQNGSGLFLNGPVTLRNGNSIDLWWTGSVWQESDRSN